ncbi:PPM-type phosphatase domain [Sesbania bispinosa]|nr:PPM-type phosphatase domain [Sesbania bispinosa]
MVHFPYSFVNGLARTVSIKKEKNCKKKHDGRKAVEELAKEAKKNELLLSSSGVVKSTKANSFVSVFTNKGQKGVNQDCLVVWEEFGCQQDMMFCGIFDGHGPWGHFVAKRDLKQHTGIDSFQSGTTALTIIKQGEYLSIANVGDCRAVLVTTSEDGTLTPIQLTTDFKPNLPQEAERIKQSRGRVFCLEDEPGVYRVWMPNSKHQD